MTKDVFLQLQELQRNSGLSLMKYLQEIGLSYSTYNYWKRKFLCQKNEESEVPFAYTFAFVYIENSVKNLPERIIPTSFCISTIFFITYFFFWLG